MLQLLLERGQSYEDIASVLGVSSDEVRERARAALRELGGSDPDAEVGLTDYLLGQADPIGRADAVRHIQSDPETAALAEKIVAQLQLIAPDADLPDVPRSKGAKVPKTERPRAKAAAGDGDGGRDGSRAAAVGETLRRWWNERRPQSIAILTALVALIVVGILALAGVFGGDDDTASGEEDTQPLLGYPLAPLEVDNKGEIKGGLPVDQLGLTVLSRSQFVDLALAPNDALSEDLTAALQQGQPVIEYQGTSVLRGDLNEAESDRRTLSLDLEPTDGSEASGGLVVRAEGKQPIIDLSLENLEPAPEGQTYVLWALLPEGTELPPASEAPTQPEGVLPEQGGGAGGGGGGGGGGG
jgi:hypothetical protein